MRTFGTGENDTENVILGDVNSDGNLDIIVTRGEYAYSEIYLNDGFGGFYAGSTTCDDPKARMRCFGSGEILNTTIAIGDMNGDGSLDLIQSGKIYLNDGAGHFYQGDEDCNTSISHVICLGMIGSAMGVGDFDGDGSLDLVLGHDGNNGETQSDVVYLNDGAGGFYSGAVDCNTPPSRVHCFGTVEGSVSSIAVADLNGDHILDLVMDNLIYLNDGAANFHQGPTDCKRPPSQVHCFGANTSNHLAIGDINTDGRLDIIATNSRGANVVYLNDGAANFYSGVVNCNTPPARIRCFNTVEGGISSLAVGDVNNDGHLDLIVGRYRGSSIVYLNDSKGGFYSGITTCNYLTPRIICFGAGLDTYSIAVGDMNGDGNLDLITGNFFNANAVYLNDGINTFYSNTVNCISPPTSVHCINGGGVTAVGDMNGDHHPDLIVGNYNQPGVIYLNDGNGGFYAGATSCNAPIASVRCFSAADTHSVAVGDMNGDGSLDIITGNDGGPSIVYLNNGAGYFYAGVVDCNRPSDGIRCFGTGDDFTITVGDVDGDGNLDIIGQGIVYLNDGSANFYYGAVNCPTPAVLVRCFGTTGNSLETGDMNGDGSLDLISDNIIYFNDGAGNFYTDSVYIDGTCQAPSNASCFGPVAANITIGDVNGDGSLDIVAGNYSTPGIVYLNNGSGHFFYGTVNCNAPSALVHCIGTGNSDSVALGDINGDGKLDLVVGNALESVSVVYLNDGSAGFHYGTVDCKSPPPYVFCFGGGKESYILAVKDMDSDNRADLIVEHPEGISVYLNSHMFIREPVNQLTQLHIADLAVTSGNKLYYNFIRAEGHIITLTYALFDPERDPVGRIEAWYSLNGGGQWLPAVPTTDTITLNLPTTTELEARTPITLTYKWDTFASGFFGQSDNVVFRLVAYPQLNQPVTPGAFHYPNLAVGPYQHPYVAATTSTFRIRGTQIQVEDENGKGVPKALVYRLTANQSLDGSFIGNTITPYQTNTQGYLQGRGALSLGDRLLALAPVALPLSYTQRYSDTLQLYYTNGEPTNEGVQTWISNTQSVAITKPGVQVLQISHKHPLLLFDLNVSLEWDASKDPIYQQQLAFDLKQASKYLYDFTNGQVALGRVRVAQDADGWGNAHVVIHATNRLRPYATIGGAVFTDTLDFNPTLPIAYEPGQVHMGAVWNRYGEPNPNPGLDWPLVLAHELSHYLFFLEDTYLGLDTPSDIGAKLLINVANCQGSAMGDVYNVDNTEFIADQTFWQSHCTKTLAATELGRTEWETIHGWYPWLFPPTQPLTGPSIMPFAFTTIEIAKPITATTVLANQDFFLDYAGGVTGSSEARAFLLRDDNKDGVFDYIYDLGNAAGTQNLLHARGTQPNDQLCIFDRPRQQYGCESVRDGDERISLFQDNAWNPVIQLTPVNSTTFTIQVINQVNTSTNLSLTARIYPEFGTAPQVANLVLGNGVYSGTLQLTFPSLAGHVQVQNLTGPQQAIVAYSIGGNPGNPRSAGGGDQHDGGGNARSAGGGGERGSGGNARSAGGGDLYPGDAPLVSPDGKLIFFATDKLRFAAGQFFTVQDMAGLPPLPVGKTAIGQGYNLVGTGFAPATSVLTGSVSFQYIGADVLTEKADENQLTIHFWNGQAWRALATYRDPIYNLVSARSQGPGIYALLAGITTPLIQTVEPAIAINDITNVLTIRGENFLQPVTVLLLGASQSYTLTLQNVNPTVLTVSVPAGLPPGEYQVWVLNNNQPGGTARPPVPGRFSLFAANKAACFYDFFESGAAQWARSGDWDIVQLANGAQAMTDSPAGPYKDAGDYGDGAALSYTTAITSTSFSLSHCPNPVLTFQHDYVLARSSQGDDLARVEISTDDGATWLTLATYTGGGVFGEGVGPSAISPEWADVVWKPVTLTLPLNGDAVRLRFSLTANKDQVTSKGWLLDNIQIKTGNPTTGGPLPEPLPPVDRPNQLYLPWVAR